MSRNAALSTLSALALVALLGGCKADPNSTDFASVKSNLTPEMQGTSERPVEIEMNMAMNANQDTRGIWDDLGRLWLTDRPTKLSPYPIMGTSGNP